MAPKATASSRASVSWTMATRGARTFVGQLSTRHRRGDVVEINQRGRRFSRVEISAANHFRTVGAARVRGSLDGELCV